MTDKITQRDPKEVKAERDKRIQDAIYNGYESIGRGAYVKTENRDGVVYSLMIRRVRAGVYAVNVWNQHQTRIGSTAKSLKEAKEHAWYLFHKLWLY